jgi:dTDP-4-amino-4,6-dideoxygalactose transaminase
MSFLLQCMTKEREKEHKDVVVVPSYTCYSVAASALKAGLKVLVCDIDKKTLSYDREQLESVDFTHVLAIVSSSLYGLPNDLPSLEKLARAKGVYLIDDAAQCLGATVQGRPVGSFGDAGILSFDKGKVITSLNGGAIVTSDPSLSQRIESEFRQIRNQPLSRRAVELAKLVAYFLFLRPSMYWLPGNLPFLGLGKTVYDEDYCVERYFDGVAPLVIAQYSRMEEINNHRRHCASHYASQIRESEGVGKFSQLSDTTPVYLRFPIRILDACARRSFLQDFRQLGCSVSYPTTIADIPEIRHRVIMQNGTCNSGQAVAAQLVTLPTHSFVRQSDIEQICHGVSTIQAESDT